MSAEESPPPNAELAEQLKRLVKTERRLQAAQREVERQLRRIRALNEFALMAPSTTSESEIIGFAIEMLANSVPFDGAVAVFETQGGSPTVMIRDSDGNTSLASPNSDEALNSALASTAVDQDVLIQDGAASDRGAIPLLGWLDERYPGLDRTHVAFKESLVIFALSSPIRKEQPELIVCRSASVSVYEEVPGEADYAFLKLACRHINSALTIARSTQHLERCVIQRTSELAAANAELERRLHELRGAQKQLVEASRQAGMAEVATSILHNVGNVLNSVNVSANLVAKLVQSSKGLGLEKAMRLLEAQPDRARFLAEDPKGQQLLDYFGVVVQALGHERQCLLSEISTLTKNVEHIRVIVSMQQAHAKTAGVIEHLSLSELIEDAIKFHAASYDRHGVQIIRDYSHAGDIQVDRHKLFQIVMNLLSNARHAVKARENSPRLIVRTRALEGDRVALEVEDNGCGIAPENMEKIFNYGFTTKREGHGFGLHSSACAAIELGGKLTVHSDGVGHGARFTVVLPLSAPSDRLANASLRAGQSASL